MSLKDREVIEPSLTLSELITAYSVWIVDRNHREQTAVSEFKNHLLLLIESKD